MARFDPLHRTLDLGALKDAVVVITGGAEGIGRAAVELFASYSARVVFGDYNHEKGRELASRLKGVEFVHMDTRLYKDNLRLFNFAMSKHGCIDHAIANAGVMEQPGWFARHSNLNDLQTAPDTMTLDVNLKGVIYFAHIACSYLSHGMSSDKSLTLLSSHGGFKETPGMPVYSTAKHGVLGLMRALRVKATLEYPHVRVNAICPSFTATRMTRGIDEAWAQAGVPKQGPEAVATVMVGLTLAGPGTRAMSYDETEIGGVHERPITGTVDWDDKTRRGLTGRAIFVLGSQAWDIEEGIDRTEPLWLGKTLSEVVRKAQTCIESEKQWLSKSETY